MLQDIYPHRLINHYDPTIQPAGEDLVMVIQGNEIYSKMTAEILFPMVKDMDTEVQNQLTYLFTIDSERYFFYAGRLEEKDGFAMHSLNELRSSKLPPKYRMHGAYTGKHLADWYRDTRFCGRCGHETKHSETERARVCPVCGYTAYPRIMPAVIVGVLNGDRMLITRYNRANAYNALVAGFTEIGETLEETVAREVMEEAGIKVKNIRYYKSQPWGVANDILTGFYCDLDGDENITMDHGELKFAGWVTREELELQPDDYSLTNEMMKNFKEGLV